MSPFSSSLELANLLVGSELLDLSLAKALELYNQISSPFSLKWNKYQCSNGVLIAFVSPPLCSKQLKGDLVSSTALKEKFPDLDFPFNRGNSSFSVHSSAIDLFEPFQSDLSQLRDQISDLLNDSNSTQVVVITGYALGGSVASLFTLWLLESLNVPAKTRPLCITFGSPLLVDSGLQKSILQHTNWDSCFLHVAAREDPIPRLFFTQPHAATYRPFGTFLFCSELGCTTSFEDPEAVSEVIVAIETEYANRQVPEKEFLMDDYSRILERIKSRIQLKGDDHLINKLVKLQETCIAKSKKGSNPSEKLNEQKKKMAYLEWYKKDSNRGKFREVGYYDRYRHHLDHGNKEITKHIKYLNNYWQNMVEEALKKPQKEGAAFRKGWLYGGNNYRRMVEPLDIAEYYRDGGRNYITQGRPQHYTQLEKWLQEAPKYAEFPINAMKKKKNVENILTEDSCFWAHVEEALISCNILKNGEASTVEKESSRTKLRDFEGYVMMQIKNYAVSCEIFLAECSYMKWWKGYEKIIGTTSHNSQLIQFMKNLDYHRYAACTW